MSAAGTHRITLGTLPIRSWPEPLEAARFLQTEAKAVADAVRLMVAFGIPVPEGLLNDLGLALEAAGAYLEDPSRRVVFDLECEAEPEAFVVSVLALWGRFRAAGPELVRPDGTVDAFPNETMATLAALCGRIFDRIGREARRSEGTAGAEMERVFELLLRGAER